MSASQLERINKLADRLAPLSGKTRGMKVEADEWNALVETLLGSLDVDRVQDGSVTATLAEKYAPREHQHRGEVTIEWLDADLQSRLEGGANSIALRTAFIELGRKVESLAAEVSRLNSVVEQQQRRLDEVSVKEVDRAKFLRGFEERFSAFESLRTQFTTMSGQFQGLSQNVASVLEIRKRLTDTATGELVDLAGMNNRIRNLERLNRNLLIDDRPINFRDLDLRLRSVEDVTGVGAGPGLDGRLNTLAADVETRFNSKLDERIEATRSRLEQQQEERATRLKETVNVRLESMKGEAARLVDTQLQASQTALAAQLDERLRATGEQLRRDVTTSAAARVEERFGQLDLPSRVRSQVEATRGELEASLRNQLGESLKGTVSASVAGAEQRLAARVAAAEGLAAKANQELPARVKAEVRAEAASLSADLDKRVGERLSKVPELLEPAIASKVETLVSGSASRLTDQVETLVQQRVADLDKRVSNAVAAELRTLPNVVSSEVQTRFAALKLNDQLTQMRGALETNLSAQVNQQVAELRARVTTNDAAVNDLRGQLTVSQRTANEAHSRTLMLEGKLTETNKNVETRFRALNPRPAGPVLDAGNVRINNR